MAIYSDLAENVFYRTCDISLLGTTSILIMHCITKKNNLDKLADYKNEVVKIFKNFNEKNSVAINIMTQERWYKHHLKRMFF